MSKNSLFSALIFVVSIMIALGVAEGVLRVKNSSMKNYDIEMWRYAKELKRQSENPLLGHEHIENKTALLQSVQIRTNEWGLRGGPVAESTADKRRILLLGSSITLGWGVSEEKTVSAQLEQMFARKGQNVEVLNGGIGNYNAPRYVERFFTQLNELKPTDIVVQYFLRDAEKLTPDGGNFLLRNSQVAVTLWIAANRVLNVSGAKSLEDHYKAVYDENEAGYQEMLAALKKLANYARQNNIRLYMAMTPDVHNLKQYPFKFIHERVEKIAASNGYSFIDLLPAFEGLSPQEVWAMPGDPHPNALGHMLMAEGIFPTLSVIGER